MFTGRKPLVYPMAVYIYYWHTQLFCIQLRHCISTTFSMVVNPRFISFLVYPMSVYTNDLALQFMSLLAYPMAVYRILVYRTTYPVPKAVNSIFPMVVHARSITLPAYPVAVYTKSMSVLLYPEVVYTSSDIGLEYPVVVYTRSILDVWIFGMTT